MGSVWLFKCVYARGLAAFADGSMQNFPVQVGLGYRHTEGICSLVGVGFPCSDLQSTKRELPYAKASAFAVPNKLLHTIIPAWYMRVGGQGSIAFV